MRSWLGAEDYRVFAEQAMAWFKKSSALNRYEPNNYLRSAMCLDWLGQPQEAYPLYQKALELDPNSYYVHALLGWHYMQVEDRSTAREWFVKSLALSGPRNPIAQSYLKIIDQKSAPSPEVKAAH